MHRFKELIVWQKAVDLAVEIYEVTKNFPKEEVYGLTSQIRRSTVSIPSNIAEGAGRDGNPEFNRFLSFAMGSSFELETQLIIAKRLEFIENDNTLSDRVIHIQNMPFKLKESLEV